MEAIYDDLPIPYGMMKSAPVVAAHGSMFSARRRAPPSPVRSSCSQRSAGTELSAAD